jgi:hypothetical protein
VTLNTRHFDIEKIKVVGGGSGPSSNEKFSTNNNDSESSEIPLCVFILLKHGRLLIWHESTPASSPSNNTKKSNSSSSQFNLAVFNVGRALTIKDICVSTNSIVLINRGGEAFKGMLNLRATPILIPNMHDPSTKNAATNNKSLGPESWGFAVKNSIRHCKSQNSIFVHKYFLSYFVVSIFLFFSFLPVGFFVLLLFYE